MEHGNTLLAAQRGPNTVGRWNTQTVAGLVVCEATNTNPALARLTCHLQDGSLTSMLLASTPLKLPAQEQPQSPHGSSLSRPRPALLCLDSSGPHMTNNPWPCQPAASASLQRWTPSFTWCPGDGVVSAASYPTLLYWGMD